MRKAIFIDFEDSFSYNVVQELFLTGFSVEVVNWKDYEKNPETNSLLVLGPGPGHPDDYQSLFFLIEEWLDQKRPFFGVCLGHQIFWRLQGAEVIRSKKPLHGQKIELLLGKDWREWLGVEKKIFVQRYNSLAVPTQERMGLDDFKNFIQDDEILMTCSSHVITYQFHPESVGTSFRQEFMGVIHSIMPR
jgi:anthranilate/para-aminobenzoate synthase component II